MLKNVLHIGITVKNLEKSIDFYQNILGLKLTGKLYMEGKETDLLFNKKNCKVKVAYLSGSDSIISPPIELIEFVNNNVDDVKEADLTKVSISEICFEVKDIDFVYNKLIENKVICLSEPQTFDFSSYGFGKSKALYFRDNNGIILELIQNL